MPPCISASSMRRANAGPLPLTAVTVSRSSSRTTTARPTEEKRCFAVFRSLSVADTSGAIAVIPRRRRTAVLGMDRRRRSPLPPALRRSELLTPATTEIRSFPARWMAFSSTTASALAGFTQRKTTEASFRASAFVEAGVTPISAAASDAFSAEEEERVILSPVVMPAASMPRMRAPPMRPPPRIAIFMTDILLATSAQARPAKRTFACL